MNRKTTILLHDYQIRKALRGLLESDFGGEPSTLIIDELPLVLQRARVDLAVINGHMTAYEIKGDGDSLRRLPSQLRAYASTMDFIWVVTTTRHLSGVREAIPSSCGLMEARPTSRGLQFLLHREARMNRLLQIRSACGLLWRQELLQLLRLKNHRKISTLSKGKLVERVLEFLSPDDIAAHLRDCLRVRGRLRLRNQRRRSALCEGQSRVWDENWIEEVRRLAAKNDSKTS